MKERHPLHKTDFFLYLLLILLLLTLPLRANYILYDVVRMVSETKESGKLPVVIFDLDGTLFHSGPRSKQIFSEFAQEQGDTILERKVKEMDAIAMKYKVRESLIDAGIEDSVLQKKIIDSWRAKFFNGEYLKYDEPISGGVEFVSELYDSGALIIYLTGRDAPCMLTGTVSALQKNGFPIGIQQTELIMKPKRYAKTFNFKKKVLKYLKKLGVVIAVFENEPANINLLYETFPDAIAIFIETNHKPNAPPVNEGIEHIKNYNSE